MKRLVLRFASVAVLALVLLAAAPTHASPLLELIGPVLRAETRDVLILPAVKMLASWMKNRDWHQRVHEALLVAVNQATPRARQLLCESLAGTWMMSEDAAVRAVGRSVIGRCLVMNGCPVDWHGPAGVVFLDEAGRPAASDRAGPLGYRIYQRLSCLTDLHVGLDAHQAWPKPLDVKAGQRQRLGALDVHGQKVEPVHAGSQQQSVQGDGFDLCHHRLVPRPLDVDTV